MDKNVKAKWVAALRSGNYTQGKNRLTTITTGGDRDCCLGVLCKVAVKEGVIDPPREMPYGGSEGGVQGERWFDGAGAVPPVSVDQWAGINTSAPRVRYLGERRALSTLNDTVGLSFAEIADLIEKYL